MLFRNLFVRRPVFLQILFKIEQKPKMSDNVELSDAQLTDWDESDMESSDTEFNHTESTESKSPAILEAYSDILPDLRELCDYCVVPPVDDDDDDPVLGAVFTVVNADKADSLRDLAEMVLQFYNDTKMKNFNLVKVCKINRGTTYFAVTFRAQEERSEESTLFRGAVHCSGGEKAVFCEIKDGEVTLLPNDDDYVSSQGSCDSKDGSPVICKNDRGDGSPANIGLGAIGGDGFPANTGHGAIASSDVQG